MSDTESESDVAGAAGEGTICPVCDATDTEEIVDIHTPEQASSGASNTILIGSATVCRERSGVMSRVASNSLSHRLRQ